MYSRERGSTWHAWAQDAAVVLRLAVLPEYPCAAESTGTSGSQAEIVVSGISSCMRQKANLECDSLRICVLRHWSFSPGS